MEKTFTFDADLTVNRLGYGTMQLPGAGVWGPAADPQHAPAVIETAIDTADAYGPLYANRYLRTALQARPNAHVMVATKVGFTRQGPGIWTPLGAPQYLKQQVELNLFTLGLDHIDLLQLHRIDPDYPLAVQLGALKDLQKEGKIRHVGLSQVTVDQLKAAEQIMPIVSVQNQYNLINRSDEDLLNYAEAHHIAFIPWYPLATGKLITNPTLIAIAQKYDASPSQIALAWLLKRSDVILPIPGTKSSNHELQNLKARDITLSDADFDALKALAN
ncbi:aldo/keto reductase [Levilactobacillus zymae]|uniref:aldo/keto reductase n=1 Tax=Levilactobacillus zymae TaxID=267363 RepID=UPI0028B527E1|nr:aldo/keto reductase [Levilactobacillus zymae]MDT6979272.1 aldo/keto reductase [Levilactobacillus zymae]